MNLPDLRNSVPAVSCTKSAALFQYSWRLPNVGHSLPSFFNSPNKAINWIRAICSFLCHGKDVFETDGSCLGLLWDRTNLAFLRIRRDAWSRERKYFKELNKTSMTLFQTEGGKRMISDTSFKHKLHELKVHCEIHILHTFMKRITFWAGLKLCWKPSDWRTGDSSWEHSSSRDFFSAGLSGVLPVSTCDRFCQPSIDL